MPVVYLVAYCLLRLSGVYYAYYSQGSWEIEGGTGIPVVDMAFFPTAVIEGSVQNKLRWLKEPTGG